MNDMNAAEPITPGVNPDSQPSVDMLLSAVNLAENLDDDLLQKLGNYVVEGYDSDEVSRSQWATRYESSLKLATQMVEVKSFPWQGAANIKYPLLTTACIQFSARAYPALVSGKEIVLAKSSGFDPTGKKAAAADRVSKHMSYQVLEEMTEWEEDMDRLLVMLPCTGTEFKKSYYDPLKGRNVSEHVLARDLVVNYWAKSLETAMRKSHVLYLSPNEIRERVLGELYLDQNLEHSTATADLYRSISDNIQGRSQPFDDEDTPFKLLECHTWCDIDEDGYKEPYILTVDHESRKVLRITARFDQEGVKYGKKNTILRIDPVEYFTKFSFIPSLDGGFYDFGWGHLLGPINETVNTTINQLLDAGTLSNMQSGFLSRGIRIRGGESKFKPGEWKFVDSTGDDLRKGVFPMPIREPSNVLFQLLGTMTQAGERLSSVVDILMGENPGQNQPATTTMAVIEQGLKVFTGVYKRLFRSLKYEFRKLYRLNRVYLPQVAYFRVLDMQDGEVMQTGQTDYQGDPTDIQPAADPNMVSDAQRLIRAQALVSSMKEGSPANPLEVWKRYYEAMRIENLDTLLPEELPQPPPDPKIIAIEMEDKHRGMEHKLEELKLQIEQEKLKFEQSKLEIEQAKLQLDQDKVAFDQEMERYQAHAQGEGDGSTTLEVLKLDMERERAERESAQKIELAKLQEEGKKEIAKLNAESAERIAQFEAQFQVILKKFEVEATNTDQAKAGEAEQAQAKQVQASAKQEGEASKKLMTALTDAIDNMNRPKKIVTDADGMPIGIKPVEKI